MNNKHRVSPRPAANPITERLVSLDALRGFDMFWIMGAVGGEAILHKITKHLEAAHLQETWYGRAVEIAVYQLTHVEWNGFRAYDLIFPLFLFVAGVAMPYSIGWRLKTGDSKRKIALKVIRRGLLLVLLGLIYNGLLSIGFTHQLRWGSVLGRIGLAYMFGGLIYLVTDVRGQALAVAVLLIGYWGAMLYVPVPEYGAGVLEDGKTLADFIDQKLMPGTLYRHHRQQGAESIPDHDPEGLLSTIPAIGTVLLGALAGTWLRSREQSGNRKTAGLILAGLLALVLGWAWSGFQLNPSNESSLTTSPSFVSQLAFPINKNLWSSSFVLWTAGWSLLLLAAFYQVIDIWRIRGWAFFFVVIGANSIVVYMAKRFIDFEKIGAFIVSPGPMTIHPVLTPIVGLGLAWGGLYVMYRKKWFIRI